MGLWLTQDGVDGVHVMPLDDLILHVRSPACTCCPRVTLLGTTHWSGVAYVRKLITHEAMDGRE